MPPDGPIKRLKSCGIKSQALCRRLCSLMIAASFSSRKRSSEDEQRTGWRADDYRIGRVFTAVRVSSSFSA